jgi:beta-glucanase (GH16 family)
MNLNSGTPDSTKWNYDLGDGCPNNCGYGNNEAQYYTNDLKNVRVENGMLIIEAHKDSLGGKAYTSTRMVSKGKGDWLYGRIEVKAKLPRGKGTWPAIWMLSTDWKYGGWPESGEIDIMEHVGYDPGVFMEPFIPKPTIILLAHKKKENLRLPIVWIISCVRH